MDLTVHIPDELVAHLGGQAVRPEMDGFRKAHDFPYDGYTLEEIEQQVATLKRLGSS